MATARIANHAIPTDPGNVAANTHRKCVVVTSKSVEGLIFGPGHFSLLRKLWPGLTTRSTPWRHADLHVTGGRTTPAIRAINLPTLSGRRAGFTLTGNTRLSVRHISPYLLRRRITYADICGAPWPVRPASITDRSGRPPGACPACPGGTPTRRPDAVRPSPVPPAPSGAPPAKPG